MSLTLKPMNANIVGPVRTLQAGGLSVNVYKDRAELGRAAAAAIASAIQSQLSRNATLAMIFASAPSQTETLHELAQNNGVPWGQVEAFHLDEYAGASENDAHSFRLFLQKHFLSKVTVRQFHPLRGEVSDLEAECARYAGLLQAAAPKIALLGIGENGHIAFNDPPVADFNDPLRVKIMELDLPCREQQVFDGAFQKLEEVPTHGMTLTVPELMRVPEVFVMVPGSRKKQAVRDAIEGPISTACPASILRTHASARLFLDVESAALLS